MYDPKRTQIIPPTIRVAAVLAALAMAGSAAAGGGRVDLCHRTLSDSNPVVRIQVAESALQAHLDHGDVAAGCGDCEPPLPDEIIPCGGFGGFPCPPGMVCVDIPGDDCDPATGADCPGMCVRPVLLACEENRDCPAGTICHDDPWDECDPDCGDANCPTVCLRTDGDTCRGFLGAECPRGPYLCIDLKGDGCSPDCEDAPCSDAQGLCIRLDEFAAQPCGGPDCLGCPPGATCVDDPTDACVPGRDPDCPSICAFVATPDDEPGDDGRDDT